MFVRKTYKIMDETKGQPCQNCSHERTYKIVEEKSWLMLIMIPLFPFKRRRLWVCSVCGAGYEEKKIKSFETIKDHKMMPPNPIDMIKEKFEKGEISKNEFIRMSNLMKYQK